MSDSDVLHQLIRKLRTRGPLNSSDVAAVLDLPYSLRTYEAPGYVVREGASAPRFCSFIRSGFAVRQKLTADGHRQIVGMNLPGDFLDLQHLFLDQADHNVQVLSRLKAVDLDRAKLAELALSRPNIGRALWVDMLIESSIYREWVLNVGRRDARQRITHLLCEFAVRMQIAGLDIAEGYELPMTQEQLADAVGLTSVHVNRTLKALEEDGVISRSRRHVLFTNWEKVRAVGDFSALYLHADQAS